MQCTAHASMRAAHGLVDRRRDHMRPKQPANDVRAPSPMHPADSTHPTAGVASPPTSGLFDSYDDITSPPELPEPEAALLLVACGIGLLTGGSIVAFNWVIHEIRDLTDLVLPVPVMPGARALAVPSAWPNLLAVPVLGALVVGALRLLMDWLEAQQSVSYAGTHHC